MEVAGRQLDWPQLPGKPELEPDETRVELIASGAAEVKSSVYGELVADACLRAAQVRVHVDHPILPGRRVQDHRESSDGERRGLERELRLVEKGGECGAPGLMEADEAGNSPDFR